MKQQDTAPQITRPVDGTKPDPGKLPRVGMTAKPHVLSTTNTGNSYLA